jgi:hypothetical protein
MSPKPPGREPPSLVLVQALGRSQSGDVDGALLLLEGIAAEGYDAQAEGFRFLLLLQKGRSDDAVAVCTRSLEQPLEPLARSTWLLRRGLLHLEFDRPLEALEDMQEVLKLHASPDHEAQARQALVKVAEQGRVQ